MELSAPQNIFLNGLDTKFRGYVGGFGSGKTFVGCLDLLIFFGRHPKTIQGYFGPSYPSIRDIFFPTFEEAAHMMGFTVQVREANKEVHLYRSGAYYGTVICRSMDRPSSIVGFKISRALVDEIDVLPKDKAKSAWQKIIARLRLVIPGVENGIGVTTTPEGFLFVYDQFANNPTASYSMVQASTYENEKFLPPDYISSLRETYPAELIDAYIEGKFVNLTSGTVYNAYDRAKNGSDEVILNGEPLFIGQDFNVGQMSSTVYVKRLNGWHAVDQLTGIYDTPALIKVIDDRYIGHKINIYPDASGASRKTVNASSSDIGLLENAGYTVRANKKNPRVKDRIISVNSAFEAGRLWVNSRKCPDVVSCFEKQSYDANGEPDKSGGFDHQNDASGYPIAYEMPIIKPVAKLKIGFAT